MEQERGCGYRKIGGFYLVGEGAPLNCDALPLDLEPCSECGFKMPFSRGIQLIPRGYLESKVKTAHPGGPCTDSFPCPICTPGDLNAFMWVSKALYTPGSFIKEAQAQGVSKRFAEGSLPQGFKLGSTWVLLAHRKVNILEDRGDFNKGFSEGPGIFYAFKPRAIEVLVWTDTKPQDRVTEGGFRLEQLEEKGYAIVRVDRTPENLARHGLKNDPPR